jgi:hypothetical protein
MELATGGVVNLAVSSRLLLIQTAEDNSVEGAIYNS